MACDPRSRPPASLRRGLVLLLALVLAGPVAGAGALIRYRRSDGSVGFAGSESSVPRGAVIVAREARSEPRTDAPEPDAEAPSIGALVSGVRRWCEGRYRRGLEEFDYCIADQTRAAFRYRDLMLTQPPGSEALRIVERCRRRFEGRAGADYERLLACAEEGQADFEVRHGIHPAEIDLGGETRAAETGRDAAERRLRKLRDDQAEAERELAIGRNEWRPRYDEAENALAEARNRTRAIVERMRSRGCRQDSLACGGLVGELERARRVEQEKRRYLEVGIFEECRLAGCQPGWLR